MPTKPTFLQSLFNQPSQKYAAPQPAHKKTPRHAARALAIRLDTSRDTSRETSRDTSPRARSRPSFPRVCVASEKPPAPDICAAPLSPPATQIASRSPSPTPSNDSDVFFTPLSSPTMAPKKSEPLPSSPLPSSPLPSSPLPSSPLPSSPLPSSPLPSSPLPSSPLPSSPLARSASSVTSSTPDDDLFSWRSATTSATSLSAPASHDSRRSRRATYHVPPGSRRPEWSKDVRWLVPPEHTHSSRSSLIQGLDLVDVEYDAAPRRQKTRSAQTDRMSALWEEEEGDEDTPQNAQKHAHPHAPARTRSQRRPTSILSRSSSASAATSRTVSLPTPLPVSAGAPSATGYTSLTLPRAAYAPAKHPARLSSAVDITRSGLAQTTMSTIAIARRPHTADTPDRLRAALPPPLSFASHTPPPSKVHASQVLVQVWAVGLDALDARLVDEQAARRDGFGYVPGRSFVGRAVECGWDVNSVAKGDWVLGLTEVRKSGALAEFIVVDRRRLAPAPRTLPLASLALLPLAGVPAHRALLTLAHLPRGARTLVLHAHDGAGLLALQALAARGVRVTAHVPGAWGSPGERRARDAGAGDVRCGGAVEVVRDMEGRGEVYDAVVDPVGGKDVWDACRRVLRASGQFTTLVGDTGSGRALPGAHAHFRSNMRSLRAALGTRGGYAWVSPAADGEDVRDALVTVARLAAEGVLAPHYEGAGVLPFERAPEAFARGAEGVLVGGGTAVVRIVE